MHLTTNPRVRPNAVKNQPGGGTAGLPSQYGQGLAPRNVNLIASLETSLCHKPVPFGLQPSMVFWPDITQKAAAASGPLTRGP